MSIRQRLDSWLAFWAVNWTEQRPWGRFKNLMESESFKVKLIEVDPQKKLSLQSHRHRAEVWTVVQGEASVELDERKFSLKVGESVSIPLGAKHRLENKNSTNLQIIEVQTGSYTGEDDIQRYEDDFGRA